MPSYLVEIYLPRSDAVRRTAFELRTRNATDQLTREGTPVAFERVIHVPADELCLVALDAPSADDAATAVQRAGLDPLRVVETIPSQEE